MDYFDSVAAGRAGAGEILPFALSASATTADAPPPAGSTLEKLRLVAVKATYGVTDAEAEMPWSASAIASIDAMVRAVVEALKQPSALFAADFDQDMWCEAVDAILEGR
ncbi:hypothetical protein [Caulobacter sp. NIBR2454]|uniref:hypothetical protein n=1 Tax=Caulobacter sp. NIBR2454 TaxID=3015996 RepID=UPI0022B6474A|nr:hypothetical protein [Caulobacter sp. NIBR2454]